MVENSGKTTRKGGNHGNGFKPGKSGNPGGRPKKTQEQKDALQMIRDLAPLAAQKLRDIIEAHDVRAADQLRAIEIILDRAYGNAYANEAVDNTLAAAREILGGINSAVE